MRETRQSQRSVFVFAQVALSTMLLISAGLLIRSLSHLTAVDPGFESERRISGTVQLPESRYGKDRDLIRFVDRLLESTEARPDVVSAAIVTRMPFHSGARQVRWWAADQAESAFRENPRAELNSVSPGYFSTMGIEVQRGRSLDISDHAEGVEVVVINATFARKFFGPLDPIGARISFVQRPRFREIVGVVEDTKQLGLAQASTYQIYVPFEQRPTARINLVVEASVDPAGIAGGIRRIVHEMDPDLALSGLSLVDDMVRDSVWRLRLLTRAFWAIGVFAVLLTAVGIAGIVSQTVVHRTREIGIRVAHGAESGHILVLVGRGIGRILALGLVAGVVSALMLGRIARGVLYGVEPGDPVTIITVVIGFAAVGVLAAWLPARRAASIDPVDALRAE
jgi:predicted permease